MTEAAEKIIDSSAEEKRTRPFYKPGYYPDLSNDEYHGSFGYGSTTIKMLAKKTKIHMDYERNNPPVETEPLLKGQLLHTMVLEPEKLDSEFAVRPIDVEKPSIRVLNAKKPSAESLVKINRWHEWQKEVDGRIEVAADLMDYCEAMAKKVHEHPIMGNWFGLEMDGLAEQSIYYWYNPEEWDQKKGYDYRIMCKVRPDYVIPGHPVIFDLKTTRDASFSGFMKQAHSLGYHISAAMYIDGCNRNKEFLDRCGVKAFEKFVWAVVENAPPYEATYYEISEKDLEEGRSLYHSLVRKLDLYNRSEWLGYGERDGDGFITPEGRVSELPGWGYNIV